MIEITKEQLHAYVIVTNKEIFPHLPWLHITFNQNELGRLFPDKLTKEACLKRLKPIPSDYYSFHYQGTSFYEAYAVLAEELIKWVEKLNS